MSGDEKDGVRPDLALLADLDAGVLDGDHARSVAAAVAADPEARAVLDALAATRADLATVTDPPVPPAVAARWRAALGQAASERAAGRAEPAAASGPIGDAAPAPGPDLADPPSPTDPGSGTADTGPTPAGRDLPRDRLPLARPRGRADRHPAREPGSPLTGRAGQRHRAFPLTAPPRPPFGRRPTGPHPGRLAPWRRPAVLAAVALLAVLVTALVLGRGPGSDPGSPGDPGVPVTAATLVAQATVSQGLHDTGPYEDARHRATCLAAVQPPGVAPTAPLLGGRQVTYEGHPGYLLVLGTGRRGAFDVVVVDPACMARLAAVHVGP